MKALLIFLFSVNAMAASEYKQAPDKLKWLKLGYEVAKAHAPDMDIIEHIVAETCEEAETWEPMTDLGETWNTVPAGYDVAYYYSKAGLLPVYYRCTKPLKG